MLGDSFELGNYPSNHQVAGERRGQGEERMKGGRDLHGKRNSRRGIIMSVCVQRKKD